MTGPRRFLLLVCVACLGGFATPAYTPTVSVARPDRAALLTYVGRDSVLDVVVHADTANHAFILFHLIKGERIELPDPAGRPCVGLALFSRAEWARARAGDRPPEDVRPGEAALRLRVYPRFGSAPAVVHDIAGGTARVVLLVDPFSAGTLTRRIAGATGRCTAE